MQRDVTLQLGHAPCARPPALGDVAATRCAFFSQLPKAALVQRVGFSPTAADAASRLRERGESGSAAPCCRGPSFPGGFFVHVHDGTRFSHSDETSCHGIAGRKGLPFRTPAELLGVYGMKSLELVSSGPLHPKQMNTPTRFLNKPPCAMSGTAHP